MDKFLTLYCSRYEGTGTKVGSFPCVVSAGVLFIRRPTTNQEGEEDDEI